MINTSKRNIKVAVPGVILPGRLRKWDCLNKFQVGCASDGGWAGGSQELRSDNSFSCGSGRSSFSGSAFFIRSILSFLLVVCMYLTGVPGYGQWSTSSVIYPKGLLKADWISCPDADLKSYGVFLLRKTFNWNKETGPFIVHVSGDQRYRLFVNGYPVCMGPARGDLQNWQYETVDIAPYLKAGKNVLATLLWNMGAGAPAAQISFQTGFVLQGNSDRERIVDTDTTWRIIRCKGYYPELFPPERLASYIVGNCDSLDFNAYPSGWKAVDYDDTYWNTPVIESPFKYYNQRRMMKPRSIPFMEEKRESINGIVRIQGLKMSDSLALLHSFEKTGGLVIGPHQKVTLLVDRRALTTAYPEITFSGGKGAKVKMIYAESLFDDQGLKGNRNQLTGKRIQGYYDVFLPDGGNRRLFRPLWIRTYRYLQFEICTNETALKLDKLEASFSAYPFKDLAGFQTSDTVLSKIWTVGWRTARLCAGETYMDCPYYEQLQYVGDTRIQALISLYVSGDNRLMRNAIEQFHQSQLPDGLTTDAYPCRGAKYIPPFSLFWISMLHDYWMHCADSAFVKKYLVSVEAVLQYFERHLDTSTGLLGELGYWNFVDWSFTFKGIPEGGLTGNSSILSLQYVYTLQQAAELFSYFGWKQKSETYAAEAERIKKAVFRCCYDERRKLLADSPQKYSFSQHANIWGILTDCIAEVDQRATMLTVIKDTSLVPTSLFYRFYFTRALKKAGLGKLYIASLGPWIKMLDLGLTTFPETTDPRVRSDCHAWSASPCYDFLATICGIESIAPGFSEISIAPNLGGLQRVSCTVPIGISQKYIKVNYSRTAMGTFTATINLPEGISGRFWTGKKYVSLSEGTQVIAFKQNRSPYESLFNKMNHSDRNSN